MPGRKNPDADLYGSVEDQGYVLPGSTPTAKINKVTCTVAPEGWLKEVSERRLSQKSE